MKHWNKINELHKRFKEENPNEEIYETTKEHRMFHTERYVIWLQNKVSELQSESDKLPIPHVSGSDEHWVCQKCGEFVDGRNVTFEEYHEGCGGRCV